jgi:hypothetical protein
MLFQNNFEPYQLATVGARNEITGAELQDWNIWYGYAGET